MNKTFKRILSSTVCCLLALSSFAACGNPVNTGNGGNSGYEAGGTIDPNISTTIRIGFYGKTEDDDKHFELLEKAFQLRYPNVSVSLVSYSASNYYQDLMQAYQAGTMPDIIQTSATDAFPLIENDLLLNLDTYVKYENDKYAANKAEYPDLFPYASFEDQFYDSMWKLGQENYNGSQYFVPRSSDRIVTYYNKKQFQEAGVDMSTVKNGWTWEQFLNACIKLKDYYSANLNGKPFISGQWQWEAVLFPMLESVGAEVFDANGAITVDSAETRRAINLIKYLVDNGYTQEKNPSQQQFLTGQAAIQFHSLNADYYYNDLGEDLGIVTFPLIGREVNGVMDYSNAKIGAGITGYGIFSELTGQKRDLAWEFLNLTLTKEGQECMADAGVSQPPIRKDMEDGSNKWRQGKENLNMEAFVWEPQRNHNTDFFLVHAASKQADLLETLIEMFNAPIRGNGSTVDGAIADCITMLNQIISMD